ncbi:hypothetical protein KUTeg_022153 [Tegillarca granosa]|uniref:Protein GPR107 n=1 Tax=Tegillarca granosa TaxID=220873 RepID=A0ABQ9E5E8_TEGGR|nr:hypothetical protein KUTeg_022153 [Tegillarca granosa]
MEVCRVDSSREKMKFITSVFLMLMMSHLSDGRIHKLNLEDDDRKEIQLSTFGLLKKGTLMVNVSQFSYTAAVGSKIDQNTFGFTLDKSGSSGISAYMESSQDKCILNRHYAANTKDDSVSIVFFRMDLQKKLLMIERKGNDVDKLDISGNMVDHKLQRRQSSIEKTKKPSKLSDNYLMPLKKARRSVTKEDKATTTATTTAKTITTGKPAVNKTTTDSKKKIKTPLQGIEPIPIISYSNGTYSFFFQVNVENEKEEGLYNLYFHNCLNYLKGSNSEITISISMVEDNNGNYLSAGEIPLPYLYFVLTVVYFAAGIVWFCVLRKAEEGVYKMHYLMFAVIMVKSLASMFHGVNYHFIAIEGIHEEAWAVLYYIVYLTRGALFFITILLIGSGWAFIKHMLSDKEKKLFLIIIPLQILDNVAYIIIEESEEGQSEYAVWKEIFILVDLLCCGAILFPVVWSIRHLQKSTNTDGKAAISLNKLKLFRQFYIMVVCYIYFTRIIVYLVKITVPFRYGWFDELSREVATFVFFVITGYKFRPASDNPYLQVPIDSDEEIEMEEV